ncbi:hypothetical protein MHU86_24937 [Fragilaria crotonensis]|nr:hypothetical protein MHU86_24937 [Fragilaria crotonensis]
MPKPNEGFGSLCFKFCCLAGHGGTFILDSSNDKDEVNDTPEWTMSQEWALLDLVPKFTVGEDVHARTFWAQLAASTPILSHFTDSDLQQRYDAIRSNRDGPGTVIHSNSTAIDAGTSAPLSFLRPPQVLQDWKVISTEGQPMRMSGILSDGRTIWFPIQTVGKFESDPAALDLEPSSMTAATAGGFVESVGGRIYELGQPATTIFMSEKETGQHKTSVVLSPQREDDEKSFKMSDAFRRFPWVSATTATMSALVASSILSAAIGYGSGLGIASIESRELSLQSASSLPPSTVMMRHHNRASGSVVVFQSSVTGMLPISEQRERAEVRVQQEQRLMERLLERLEQDQVVLQLLKMEEGFAGSLAP